MSIRENAIFFNDYCAFSRSFLTSFHPTRSTILPPEPPKQNKTKQNKTNTDKTLKNDRVDLVKRISKSDISVGRNWILFWWALTNHSVNSVILDQNNATLTSAKLLIQKQFHLFANFCAILPSSLNRKKTHPPHPLFIVVLFSKPIISCYSKQHWIRGAEGGGGRGGAGRGRRERAFIWWRFPFLIGWQGKKSIFDREKKKNFCDVPQKALS